MREKVCKVQKMEERTELLLIEPGFNYEAVNIKKQWIGELGQEFSILEGEGDEQKCPSIKSKSVRIKLICN